MIPTLTSQCKHNPNVKFLVSFQRNCGFSTLGYDTFWCVTTRNKVAKEIEEQELSNEMNMIINNNNKVRGLLF